MIEHSWKQGTENQTENKLKEFYDKREYEEVMEVLAIKQTPKVLL